MEREYSFTVNDVSKLDGKKYEGIFHMRRPNIADLGAISAALSRLNQGQPFASDSFEAILTVVATIEVCCEDPPKWWKAMVDEMADVGMIMRISTHMSEARDKGIPFRSEKDQPQESSD